MEDDAVTVAEAESLLHKREEQKEEDSRQPETEAEVKGAGLLDHIIHNLVSPLNPRSSSRDHVSNQKKDEVFGSNGGARSENDEGFGSEEVRSNVNNGEGWLIKTAISNVFHPSDQQQAEVAEHDKKNEADLVESEEKEQVKKEDEDGASGIIGNIVSHLPTSLPDDVAPTTDEASVLIHSIIHD